MLMEAAGAWTKSSASSGNGNCVEARVTVSGVNLRDSKDPDGPVLSVPSEAWTAFLAGAKSGEFDLF